MELQRRITKRSLHIIGFWKRDYYDTINIILSAFVGHYLVILPPADKHALHGQHNHKEHLINLLWQAGMQNKTVHWRQDHNDSNDEDDDDDESPRVIITSNYRALESWLDFLAPGCLVVHVVVGYDDALINKKAIQSESSSRPIYRQAGMAGQVHPFHPVQRLTQVV